MTPWSFLHFLSGAVLCVLLCNVKHPLLWAISLHTLYEVKDLAISYCLKASDPNNNSVQNSIGDTIFFLIGYFCMDMFNQDVISNRYTQISVVALYSFFVVLFSNLGYG